MGASELLQRLDCSLRPINLQPTRNPQPHSVVGQYESKPTVLPDFNLTPAPR